MDRNEAEQLIGELAAVRAITMVIQQAARASDRADLELLKSCYHPDAYEDHGYFQGNAWDFADQAVKIQVGKYETACHYLAQPMIEVAGDRAFAETYVQAVMISRDDDNRRQTLTFAGRYLDTLERRDGAWKIAQRITVNDFATTSTLEGPTWPWGDEPVFVRGTQSTADPSYLRTEPEQLRRSPRS